MLTYSFENRNNLSLYEHLYNCIKNDILDGKLPANYRLPSKRTFAKNLNISTITVETAYSQLIAEGYIYSLPKKGYYVSDISGTSEATMQQNYAPGDIAIFTNSKADTSDEKSYFADLSSNRTIADNFPFKTWTRLIREIYLEKSQELMKVSPSNGVYELRLAIAKHLLAFRGMQVSPDQIIIGAGTEYLYGLLIQLLGHNNIYAVEDPGYSKIKKIYKSNNVSLALIPMDNNGININRLEKSNAKVVHISPSHHFPTGIVTSISRRYELLAWASKSPGRYIIEDDYDSEFRLLGKPIPSMKNIDTSGKVIYMNTFTKTLTPTIRISYMVLPEKLANQFNNQLSFYSCTVSNFEQYTLAKFIEEGYFEKHINRMRNFYRHQRDIFIDAAEKAGLFKVAKIYEENSGLHFLLKLSTSLKEDTILENAEKNSIKLAFLSEYYEKKNKNSDHTLVINYSSIEPEKINEVIKRLLNSI